MDTLSQVLDYWIENYSSNDFYQWGIELKETGELIGSVAVAAYDEENSSASLGWCLGKRWWGNGIMPEAVTAVMVHLFNEVGFQRITACHDIKNKRSGRVMEKVGMKKEGIIRKSMKNNRGKVIDVVLYSLTQSDLKEVLPALSVHNSRAVFP